MACALQGALPQTLTGVIFDCDGVIINSRASNAMYFNKILEALDLPPLTKEQEAFTFMSTVAQALEYIVPKHLQGELAHICKHVVDYRRDIMPHVRLEEGFLDFHAWLREKGLRTAVHTNRSNGMKFVLDAFDLHGYFDPVMTATDVAPKPSPEGIHAILQCWNTTADKLLFIGDSVTDQKAAAAGGVCFVAFGNEVLDAPLKVTTYVELQKALNASFCNTH